jgi:hypothetical protein
MQSQVPSVFLASSRWLAQSGLGCASDSTIFLQKMSVSTTIVSSHQIYATTGVISWLFVMHGSWLVELVAAPILARIGPGPARFAERSSSGSMANQLLISSTLLQYCDLGLCTVLCIKDMYLNSFNSKNNTKVWHLIPAQNPRRLLIYAAWSKDKILNFVLPQIILTLQAMPQV